jgi:hypothetical protein
MKLLIGYKVEISKEITNDGIGVFFQGLVDENRMVNISTEVTSSIIDAPFNDITEDSLEYFKENIEESFKKKYSDDSYFFYVTILSITKINK